MSYALSNTGQGATAHCMITPWNRPTSGDWWIRIKFSVDSTASNQHLIGRSDSTAGSLRVVTGGILRLRDNGSDLISSPSGTIVAGTTYDAKFGRAGSSFFLELDTIPVGTATYAASQITNPFNQVFRFSTTLYGVGTVYEVETSGGTYNTLLNGSNAPSTGTTWTDGISTLTATNFTGAADSWWVFYSTGVSWTGIIGKTSLTVSNKQLFVALGYTNTVGKSSGSVSTKTLSVASGYNNSIVKSSQNISPKTLSVALGYNSSIGKTPLVLNSKQLSISAGSALSFTGLLNKSTYPLSPKQLQVVAGWNSSAGLYNLTLSGKSEGVSIGQVLNIQEQSLTLSDKQLSIQTGTSVSFIGEISKSSLNAVGKPLIVSAGASLGFVGLVGKTSLQLNGRVLDRVSGHVLSIQKQSLNLVLKQLSIGEQIYPIVPIERIFTLTENNRTYLFKQTTNVYIIKNKENILWL